MGQDWRQFSQKDDPEADVKWPIGQREQFSGPCAPKTDMYFPGVHIKHVEETTALKAVENLPGTHNVQLFSATSPDPV